MGRLPITVKQLVDDSARMADALKGLTLFRAIVHSLSPRKLIRGGTSFSQADRRDKLLQGSL